MKRLRPVIVSLAFSAAATAPTVAASEPAAAVDSVLERLLGSYRHAGGERDKKARDDAIDDVVKHMNVLVRSIARSRLEQANPIPARVRIARIGDDLSISMDDRSYRAPIDGRSVKVKGITGDELEMHFRVDGQTLVQIFEGDGGGRINRFSPSGDGELTMKVRVFSERLPKDLEYRLGYRRQ